MSEEENKIGEVQPLNIAEEMKESYLSYAMSVIVSRALPDVRDGLKPVQRRILFAMKKMGLTPGSSFRKSATVVGQCFTEGTLVPTTQGLKEIQSIESGEMVLTQSGTRRVTDSFEISPRPLLRVTMQNGLTNTVTPSQKFKVLTPDLTFDWKEAKDLDKQDYLVMKASCPELENYVELEQIESGQPERLDEDLAYLLGFFVSDGSISRRYDNKECFRISFFAGLEREIAEKLVNILDEKFDYRPTIEEHEYKLEKKDGSVADRKQYLVRVNRSAVSSFFVRNFGIEDVNSRIKEIPGEIFRSPDSVIFSFISGLIDGDGSISSNRNQVHYGTVSEKLSDQLLTLLFHKGIVGSRRITDPEDCATNSVGREIIRNYPYHNIEFYGEMALKLVAKLDLVHSRKKQKAQEIIRRKDEQVGWSKWDTIPYAGEVLFGELSENHLGAGWYEDTDGNKFRQGIKHPSGCKIRYSSDLHEKPLGMTQVVEWGIRDKLERIGSPFLEFVDHSIENNLIFMKVSSIEEVEADTTYDIEVDEDHEFIANGVVSHNCIGNYHPHGDAAVYAAMARMSQDFSLRYPLVEPQGNMGSQDGDPPAAARYTEAKLSELGNLMLQDIQKETVDMRENFDGTKEEPTVLPSPLPQMLLNGTIGIAVGMATKIPPHNLTEVCDAALHLVENPDATTEDLLEFIKGPDFPSGGVIYNKEEIEEAYSSGKGSIVIRGRAEIVRGKKRTNIIISEIPFGVNKPKLLMQIAKLVSNEKITKIRNIRDESDRDGVRVVLELKRGSAPRRILNFLYKKTYLQHKFHMNMVVLEGGIQPKRMSLSDILSNFVDHRKEVVRRRAEHDKAVAEARAHILKGFELALGDIDEVIETIKGSDDRADAQKNLMEEFSLSERQADAILNMRLSVLSRMERDKIENELKEKKDIIDELTELLGDEKKITATVGEELEDVKEKYGDERKTMVLDKKADEISSDDLIPEEEAIITLTKQGMIKRMKPSSYRIQKRGGKGVIGAKTKERDEIDHLVFTNTHDYLYFFTDSGKVFKSRAFEVPAASRTAKGQNIMNFLQLSSDEKVLAILSLNKEEEKDEDSYFVMVTENGRIKKTDISEFKSVRRNGLIAVGLKEGDLLRGATMVSKGQDILLVSRKGKAIRFNQDEVRSMGRSAMGVKGMDLDDDKVVAMGIADSKGELLTITEHGYGKRTELSEYRSQKRGGKGLKTADITDKTGQIVDAKILNGDKGLIIISQKAQAIRTEVKEVSQMGRVTQGVRVMKLDEGDKVASVTCL